MAEYVPALDQSTTENYRRAMAKSPQLLKAFVPFEEAVLAPGALDARLKTLAYLAASYVNESPYCVMRFHGRARRAGFSEDEIRAVQTEQDHVFKGLDHLVIRVARELTGTCTLDDIEEDDLNQLSAEQIVELAAVVSLANFDNRFANALDIPTEKHPTEK